MGREFGTVLSNQYIRQVLCIIYYLLVIYIKKLKIGVINISKLLYHFNI